jgi:hypothetical protein
MVRTARAEMSLQILYSKRLEGASSMGILFQHFRDGVMPVLFR